MTLFVKSWKELWPVCPCDGLEASTLATWAMSALEPAIRVGRREDLGIARRRVEEPALGGVLGVMVVGPARSCWARLRCCWRREAGRQERLESGIGRRGELLLERRDGLGVHLDHHVEEVLVEVRRARTDRAGEELESHGLVAGRKRRRQDHPPGVGQRPELESGVAMVAEQERGVLLHIGPGTQDRFLSASVSSLLFDDASCCMARTSAVVVGVLTPPPGTEDRSGTVERSVFASSASNSIRCLNRPAWIVPRDIPGLASTVDLQGRARPSAGSGCGLRAKPGEAGLR